MPFLGSKYAKMLLRPGLCPGPRWGSLQRSTRPPSWIKGGLLLSGGGGEGKRNGRGGKGRGGEGKGEEGKGGEERGRRILRPPPFLKFLDPPLRGLCCQPVLTHRICNKLTTNFCNITTILRFFQHTRTAHSVL